MTTYMMNTELTEAVQAIKDMTTALLNQRHEGTTESQDLVEFRETTSTIL